jgi:hypothetical protein
VKQWKYHDSMALKRLSFRWADTVNGITIQRGEDEHGNLIGYYIGKKGPWLTLEGCRARAKHLGAKRKKK